MSERNGCAQPFYSPPKDANNAEIRLMRKLEKECGRKFADYEDFYRFTCTNYPTFWKAILEFCDIRTYSNYTQIVEDKSIEQVPKWFPGATTNYTDNCLKNGDPNRVAFIQACKSLF
jgi:acetoacetyl-CoA synthetase